MNPHGTVINGLDPLALKIALFLHSAEGIVRMDTIRQVAHESRLESHLPKALTQLRKWNVAEPCSECDCLVGSSCDGEGCEQHRYVGRSRTRHLPNCRQAIPKRTAVGTPVTPAAGKKLA